MGTPGFIPARLFADARNFGRNSLADPEMPSALSSVEAAWAWYQHQACLMVFDQLYFRSLSVSDFALGLDADVAWTVRKLHGQTPVSLGDLLEWSMYLGVPVLPSVGSVADLLVPEGDS